MDTGYEKLTYITSVEAQVFGIVALVATTVKYVPAALNATAETVDAEVTRIPSGWSVAASTPPFPIIADIEAPIEVRSILKLAGVEKVIEPVGRVAPHVAVPVIVTTPEAIE